MELGFNEIKTENMFSEWTKYYCTKKFDLNLI